MKKIHEVIDPSLCSIFGLFGLGMLAASFGQASYIEDIAANNTTPAIQESVTELQSNSHFFMGLGGITATLGFGLAAYGVIGRQRRNDEDVVNETLGDGVVLTSGNEGIQAQEPEVQLQVPTTAAFKWF